jgi:hypothetical protein
MDNLEKADSPIECCFDYLGHGDFRFANASE